jgi:hypothetical protein
LKERRGLWRGLGNSLNRDCWDNNFLFNSGSFWLLVQQTVAMKKEVYKCCGEHPSFFGTPITQIERIRQITEVRKPEPIRFYPEKQSWRSDITRETF